MRLLLIRHAKSDWADPGRPDHERPLNGRGRRDAPRMGAWIAERGLAPDEVFCSDALRTRQTLDLMLPLWPAPPRLAHLRTLYHAEPEAMLGVLAGATGKTVALVGHNPGVGTLAGDLAREAPHHPRWDDFPTCAVAAFDLDAEGWADVRRGAVLAFAIPADLP